MILEQALRPDWPAPKHVHTLVTTRVGGVSVSPYDSLNLGDHVGDDPQAVAANRDRLAAALGRIAPVATAQWLTQVHGVTVLEAELDATSRAQSQPKADAVTTTAKGLPVVVMTADCLPVFFCDRAGTRVAVAHAGWRGLCDGVLEATVATFTSSSDVMAWLGPAIGPAAFEVGDEVRQAFLQHDPEASKAFQAKADKPGHWLADIYLLARQRLAALGVTEISGGGRCTYSEPAHFYSYRRDGKTGRMASVIWLSEASK